MENQEFQKSQAKITVAFKCTPSLKNKITDEAKQLGISLSECAENIVSKHYDVSSSIIKTEAKDSPELTNTGQDIKAYFDNLEAKLPDLLAQEVSAMIVEIDEIKTLLLSNQTFKDVKETSEKLKTLTEQNDSLTKELEAIKGIEGLQQLFEEYKGRKLDYKNTQGQKQTIKINTYADVITALIGIIRDNKQSKTE